MIPPPDNEPKETTPVLMSRPLSETAALFPSPDTFIVPEDDDERERAETAERERKKPMRKKKITFIHYKGQKSPEIVKIAVNSDRILSFSPNFRAL